MLIDYVKNNKRKKVRKRMTEDKKQSIEVEYDEDLVKDAESIQTVFNEDSIEELNEEGQVIENAN